MAFNVNSFKAKGLEGGGARPALFEVVLTPPAGLPNVAEKISFLCRATAIPASTIGVVDVYHFGRPIRLAGDRTFSDWQVSIYNDEDFSIRDMLELWSNKINTHISNRLDPGYQSITPKNNNRSYKATGIVRQYGKTGPGDAAGIIRAYQFEGIFPFNISEIDLGSDITDTVETFSCTFAYDYWIPIPKNKDGTTSQNPDGWGLLQPDNG
jgi:hypothetical protein